MKPAYVKLKRFCMQGVNSWMEIIDAKTEEVVGEGKNINVAADMAEAKGYQIMGYEQAKAMVD